MASRRALATRWHRSPAGVQKLLTAWQRAGLIRMEIGRCCRLCRGLKRDHTSVVVLLALAPSRCSDVISEAVARVLSTSSEQITTEEPTEVGTVLLTLSRIAAPTPYDRQTVARLVRRVDLDTIARGLKRVAYSGFLRGKRRGRLGTAFTLTVPWLADHIERVARGDFDDRGAFGSPPPEPRPVLFPDGSPLTPARLDEWQALKRRRAA